MLCIPVSLSLFCFRLSVRIRVRKPVRSTPLDGNRPAQHASLSRAPTARDPGINPSRIRSVALSFLTGSLVRDPGGPTPFQHKPPDIRDNVQTSNDLFVFGVLESVSNLII